MLSRDPARFDQPVEDGLILDDSRFLPNRHDEQFKSPDLVVLEGIHALRQEPVVRPVENQGK